MRYPGGEDLGCGGWGLVFRTGVASRAEGLVAALTGPSLLCPQLSPEEEEKRRIRRERNKMAAAKCRNRRRELTDTLQAVSAAWEVLGWA